MNLSIKTDGNRKSIIVTGASGMLGQALMKVMPRDTKIIWISNTRMTVSLDSPESWNYVNLDLSDKLAISNLLEKTDFETIIHCAASTNINKCEDNINYALNGNLISTKNILDAINLKNMKIRIIYISSDSVYPDTSMSELKDENMAPRPNNIYGMTKYWSEMLIEKYANNYLILRTTIVGLAKGHFIDWVINSALNRKKIFLYNNVIFSPVSVFNFAQFISKVINIHKIGIFNYCSKDHCSKADFAILLMENLNIIFEYELVDLIKDKEYRSLNMIMDPSKIELEFMINMPFVIDAVKEISLNYRNDMA